MIPEILEKGRVLKWYEATKDSPGNLFGLELERDQFDGELYLTDAYIAKHGLRDDLELFMLSERCLITQLFVDGHLSLDERSATGMNWTLKLLGWYTSLSEDERRELPVYGNKIGVRSLARQVRQFSNIGKLVDYPSVRSALQWINEQHLNDGYLDPDYRPVDIRPSKKSEKSDSSLGEKSREFKRLSNVRVIHVDDLEVASPSRLFQSIRHLFAYAASFNDNWRGSMNAFDYFEQFLTEGGLEGTEDLFETLGAFSLVRYRSWLSDKIVEKVISPATANTVLSKARICCKSLVGMAGAEKFVYYDVEGFDPVRVTDLYRPYTLSERDRIARAVKEDIELYNRLAKPYVKSGLGCDPYDDDQSRIKIGYATLDNMRWVFENHLKCVVPTADELKLPGYASSFVKTINRLVGNVKPVYQSWGVLPNVDQAVITPYVIRLAQVTGLNADSLKWLDLDDYAPYHPVTRRPCLRYWKERSCGEKLYHLDLVSADITWLTSAQSVEVSKIFDDVKYLTSRFRSEAPEELAGKLFIWKSTGNNSFGKIKGLATAKPTIVARLFSEYSKGKGLVDDNGEPLGLSASRLRPSFISELIDKGVSPREVQVILGHAKLRTTIAYLDRMDFNRFARKKLDAAIATLHADAVREAITELVDDESRVSDPKKPELDPQIIFKTPLADCANIFNPPEFVRRLASYVPGTPCAMYNKCLACDNSIITVAHLPQLFAMNRDYNRLVEVSRVMDTPYGVVVKENMSLLKKILDPSLSDFSEDELRSAQRLSEYIETTILIDGVGV